MTYIRGLGVRVHVFAEASKLHFRSLANTQEAPEPAKCPLVKVPFSVSKLQANLVDTPAVRGSYDANEGSLMNDDDSRVENLTLTLEFDLAASVACSAAVLCNLEKAVLKAPAGNTAAEASEDEDAASSAPVTENTSASPSTSSETGATGQRYFDREDEEAGIELQPVTPQLALPHRASARSRRGFVRLPAADAGDEDDDDQDDNGPDEAGAATEESNSGDGGSGRTALALPPSSDEEEVDGDDQGLHRNSHGRDSAPQPESSRECANTSAEAAGDSAAAGALAASSPQTISRQAAGAEPRRVTVKVDLPPGQEPLLLQRRPDVYQLALVLRPLNNEDKASSIAGGDLATQAELNLHNRSDSSQAMNTSSESRQAQEPATVSSRSKASSNFAARLGQRSTTGSTQDNGPEYARVTNNAPEAPATSPTMTPSGSAAGVSFADASNLLGFDRVRSRSRTYVANERPVPRDHDDLLVSHLLILEIDRRDEKRSSRSSGIRGGGSEGSSSSNNRAELQALRVRIASQVNVTTRGVYTTQSIYGLQASRPHVAEPSNENGSESGGGNESSSGSDGSPTSEGSSSSSDGNAGGEADSSECVICLTNPRDTVLLPCRHLCCCQACFPHLDKCPVCRAPFDSHLVFEHNSDDDDTSGQEEANTGEQKCEDNGFDKSAAACDSSHLPARSAVLTSTPSPLHAASTQQEDRVHEDLL